MRSISILKIPAFLLLVALFAVSCKTTKTGSGVLKERSADYLMKKMAENQLKADWLSAKIKVSFDSEDMAASFSGTLRMKKDSAIWIQMKKLGFEVARVLVLKDSVYVIDRFNNEFDVQSFDYVRRIANFPLTFEMLQSLILGNPVFFSKKMQTEIAGLDYRLWSEPGSPSGEYLLHGGDFSLKKMTFHERQPERTFEMGLSKYAEPAKRRNFSYFRQLKMNSRETGIVTAQIEFADVELDSPKSMPFEIPQRYRRD